MQDADDDDDPEIIFSEHCCEVELDDHRLTVEIYRTDRDTGWILEVLNEFGTSTVHDEPFIGDGIAWRAFEATVAEEGLMAFMSDSDRKKLSH